MKSFSRREQKKRVNLARRRNVRSRLQKHCTQKQRYEDQDAAEAAVLRQKERIVYINDLSIKGRLEAYCCTRCGHWHIGHSSDSMRGGNCP